MAIQINNTTVIDDSRNIQNIGIITATGGFSIGIQSAGSDQAIGVITAINFIGAGNTFRYDPAKKVVDVSIQGGGGGGVSTTGIATAAIFSNFGTIYQNQSLGQSGYNYFAAGPLAVTATVTVGAGSTFVII